ncbi:MAG: cytochrome c biogenesis CcdA family protein [Patescibacteria group bacterium]|jgi:cytochrome c biogenesis protein CcdA
MKKIIYLIVFLSAFWPALALAQYSPVGDNQNIYYYSATCPHCLNVHEFFDQYDILKKYNIIEKEVSQNPKNAKEFYDLCVAKSVPPEDIGVPYLHFEGQCLSGDQPIIDFFKAKLGLMEESQPPNGGPATGKTDNGLTIGAVTVAALADSINPCAFSVMIFLMLSLLAIGAKKRMLKIGITYIITVYIVYLAAGLGLLATFQWLSVISKYILWLAAGLAIIAGLINIKDFFWYGQGITLAIPEDKKPLLEKYIKHASLPAAIVLGFLVALFELPCTGGFYLAILALLAQEMTYWSGVAYLLFYNIVFVAPLFIILAIVYKGVSPQQLENWRTAKRKWLRLLMGLVLVVLGLSLIFLF